MGKGKTVIIDGRLIDVEKTSIEELEKLKKKLEEKERDLKAKIEELLAKEDY